MGRRPDHGEDRGPDHDTDHERQRRAHARRHHERRHGQGWEDLAQRVAALEAVLELMLNARTANVEGPVLEQLLKHLGLERVDLVDEIRRAQEAVLKGGENP